MQSCTNIFIYHGDGFADAILSSKIEQARLLLSWYHDFGTANGEHWWISPLQRDISAARLIH